MGVTVTEFGSNTLWNFVETQEQGANWPSRPIDPASTSSQLISSFQFEGKDVRLSFTGSFPESLQSFNNLGGLAQQGSSSVTSYELKLAGQTFELSTIQPGISLSVVLGGMTGNETSVLQQYFSGNDVFIGSQQGSTEGDDDGVNGYAGNDVFYGNATSGNSTNADKFFGNSGIDTIVLRGAKGEYTLSNQNVWMPNGLEGMGFLITDKIAGRDGQKAIRQVERIEFSDGQKLALDLDGNAGKVAKVLAASFGASAVNNKQYVKIGLDLVDGGTSYSDLAALAIKAAGGTTREAAVSLVWNNLMGKAPTAVEAKPFVDMISADMSNLGSVGTMASDFAASIGKVSLVGLGQVGLAYA